MEGIYSLASSSAIELGWLLLLMLLLEVVGVGVVVILVLLSGRAGGV
jgi:hypothetical protein